MLQFLPAHVIAIALGFTIGISWQIILACILLWIIIGGFGIELGYHRAISHNHFQFSDRMKKILGTVGLFGMNGTPMSWRGIHIVHHRFADTDKDFHTPTKGLLNAYIGYTWKFSRQSNLNNMPFILATKHMNRDRYWVFLEKWTHLGIFLLLMSLTFTLPHVALVLSLVMIMCYNQTALVNIISHSGHGERLAETNDNSVNNKFLSIFTFGLSIHNNHHANMSQENFASDGYIDIGFYLGKLIKILDTR